MSKLRGFLSVGMMLLCGLLLSLVFLPVMIFPMAQDRVKPLRYDYVNGEYCYINEESPETFCRYASENTRKIAKIKPSQCGKKIISPEDAVNYALAAGFNIEGTIKIVAIAQSESGLNQYACGCNAYNGEIWSWDRGILQFNSYCLAADTKNGVTDEQAFDPAQAFRAAFAFREDFAPWRHSRPTDKHYTNARQAVFKALSPQYEARPREATLDQEVTLTLTIKNPSKSPWTFYAAVTLRRPDGTKVDLPGDPGFYTKRLTIPSGLAGSVSWTYSPNVVGDWDVIFGIWLEQDQRTPLGNTGWINDYIKVSERPPSPRDLDGDGVPDDRDQCPNIPGPSWNNGCPEVIPPPPAGNPPIANFTFSPLDAKVNEIINFSNQSTDPDGDIVSWFWEFGDGSTSTDWNPSHSYSQAGTYTVRLSVRDSGGRSDTISKSITVREAVLPPPPNQPPIAQFTFTPTNPIVGQSVFFDASSSFDPDPGDYITQYHWDFDNDGHFEADTQTVYHTFSFPGSYTVVLLVIDSRGSSSSQHQIISVSSVPSLNGNIQVNATLNGMPWEGVISYFRLIGPQNWDLGGAMMVPTEFRDLPPGTWTFEFQSGGPSGATLANISPSSIQTLTAGGTITFTLNFVTTPPPPSGGNPPRASFTFSPLEPKVNEPVFFTDQSTDPDNDIVSWSWDFGDGITNTSQNPSHSYQRAGSYTVRLLVKDSRGNSDTISKNIIVVEATALPQVFFTDRNGQPVNGWQIGDPVYIIVIDPTKNRDPTEREWLGGTFIDEFGREQQVMRLFAQNSGDEETRWLLLIETGPNTGTFCTVTGFDIFLLPSGQTAIANNMTLEVEDNDVIHLYYDSHQYSLPALAAQPSLPTDSDNDGVPDNADSCPSQPGPSWNNGCPEGTPLPPPPPLPPSPPGGKSIEEAIDTNGNYLIDDPEILKAVEYWIQGIPVPGTDGQLIDDRKMLELIEIWISARALSPSLAGRELKGERLSLQGVRSFPNPVKDSIVRFQIEGKGIIATRVEVFNLSGHLVYDSGFRSGNSLQWNLLTTNAQALANGVYLYVITVRGFNGTILRSELKKLVVLK